jgi:hypothetical protein
MAEPIAPAALDLDRECVALARYLVGQVPTTYVLGKYRDAHARHPHLHGTDAPADRFLLRFARRSLAALWLVDCYTALFFRTATIRRKAVLVVALLESSAPAAGYFDEPDRGSAGRQIARLCLKGMTFAIGVCGSILVLAPMHALWRGRSQ